MIVRSSSPDPSWPLRALLVLLMLALVAACAVRSDPEQALRETMAELEQALDQRDASAISDLLADDFAGPEGMGTDEVERLATAMFLRYRNTQVQVTSPRIALQGSDRATVEARVALLGGGAALLPESGQLYAVTTGWRLDGGEWRLVHARWEPVL